MEMSFPKVKWSGPYYVKLKEFLVSESIDFNISDITEISPVEFVDINCSADVEFCVKLTKDIFKKVFDHKEENLNYKIKFYNVSPKDEKIGF